MAKKKFAVIDSETPPFAYGRTDILPFLWGYYDGIEYHQFTDTAELVAFISERDEIIYAHNGGKFDFHFLADFFEAGRPIMLINGRIAKLKLGKCELRDSYNIIPAPLADFQKTKVDYSIFEADKRTDKGNWKIICDYLRDDCYDLYALVSEFIAMNGLALTQAGACMKAFKKIYDVEVKTTETYFNHFKDFYYGGRVQVFKKGIIETPFEVYDINSAYPAGMLSEHWFSDRVIQVKCKDINFANECPQAFFDIDCISDGALPYRGKMKLLFPSDNVRRNYLVTGWEINAALKWGALRDIKINAVYAPDKTLSFDKYIVPAYESRLAYKASGDKARTLLYKLMMNSLYGKFGANPSNYTRAVLFDSEYHKSLVTTGIHYKNGKITEYADDPLYTLGGAIGDVLIGERELFDFEKQYYNVATAASITGHVRAFLYDSIMAVGRDNVLYCDTDSLVTLTGQGLKCSDKLGDWKKVGDFNRAAIAGRKTYALFGAGEPVIACKGVRLTAEEIEQVAKGRQVTAHNFAPTFTVKKKMHYVSRNVLSTE